MNKYCLSFSVWLITLVFSHSVFANTEQIDRYLATLFNPDKPGAAVLVVKDGKTVFKKAYGMANLELNVLHSPDMVFHAGSVTKQFTAAAILRLAEQGKLQIRQSIRHYMPDVPNTWQAITLEHLLTHTSGIKNLFMEADYRKGMREDKKPADDLAYAVTLPLLAAPGELFHYSSFNYVVLALVIEKVSGQSYKDFIAQQFLLPLNMKYTKLDHPHSLITGLVSPYVHGPQPAPFVSHTALLGAGSYFTTVDDLALWTLALQNGKVLNSASLKAMNTAFRVNDGSNIHYGYGVRPHGTQADPYIQSNGDIFGYHAEVVYQPKAKLLVAILSNSEELELGLDPVAQHIAALADGTPESEPASIVLPRDKLNALTGSYANGPRVRQISVHNGKLTSQFPDSAAETLTAISASEFYFDTSPSERLSFTSKNGKFDKVTLHLADRGPAAIYVKIQTAPKQE